MKKTSIYKMLFLLLLATSFIFVTIGCESSDTIEPDESNLSANEATLTPTDLSEKVDLNEISDYNEVLTIAVLVDWVIRPVAERFVQENPGTRIEIISFNSAFFDMDLDTPRSQMAVELMAGGGPVLIESWVLDTLDSRVFPFMVDWFTVMDTDPEFKESDWFMNVFHALTIDGKLYQFPVEFLYESVAANGAIPGLLDVFLGRDSVTVTEMMQIYRELITYSPKIIAPTFSPRWLTPFYIGEFLDMETATADFNNRQFIDFISDAFDARDTIGIGTFDIAEEAHWSSDYIFSVVSPGNSIDHFLDFTVGSVFTGAIPLVDAEGNLIVSSNSSFVLNAANSTPAQRTLAWDFIMFMMEPGNQPAMPIFQQHVNRNLMRHSAEQFFRNRMEQYRHLGWQLAVTEYEALERIIERMTSIGEMPMTRRGAAVPQLIQETISEALHLFEDGLATAEQTAQFLQSRITLILMEMG